MEEPAIQIGFLMTVSPLITIHEVGAGGELTEREHRFEPDDIYALGATLDVVIPQFRQQEDENIRKVIDVFDEYIAHGLEALEDEFSSYCAASSAAGDPNDTEGLSPGPEDFTEETRLFLSRFFLADAILDPQRGFFILPLFGVFERILELLGEALPESDEVDEETVTNELAFIADMKGQMHVIMDYAKESVENDQTFVFQLADGEEDD